MSEPRIRCFTVQWHLTARCGNRCRHCYVYDRTTYEAERTHERDLTGLIEILDRIREFEQKWDARIPRFTVTGGDPLLHPDCAALLRELRGRGKTVSVLGNPETLTPDNLTTLADLGLSSFQLSLDGLEATHDRFRGSGSFARTLDGVHQLKEAGIPVHIMLTLYQENAPDLVPLLELVATRTPADSFCFDLGTCVGNANSLRSDFDGEDLRSMLSAYLAAKERLTKAGCALRIVEKCNFLKLARFEQSSFCPICSEGVPVVTGCVAGWTFLSILADGTVLPCRELPLKAGKLPEQSFEEILLGATPLKKLRRRQFFTGCGPCDFYQHCRGCPAVVRGLTGDAFAGHPLCFRNSIGREAVPHDPAPSPLPLETSLEQEHDLIAGHFANVFAARRGELLERQAVREALFRLCQGEQDRQQFQAEPDAYLARGGLSLSGLEKLFVTHFVERLPPDGPAHAPLYQRLFLDRF